MATRKAGVGVGVGSCCFVCNNFHMGEAENSWWRGEPSLTLPWVQSWLGPTPEQASLPFSSPKAVPRLWPTSVVRRPFCFWVREPELRLWGFGHWVPQLIFSGLDIPLGAADRGTPLEDNPSSSTPGGGKQRMALESRTWQWLQTIPKSVKRHSQIEVSPEILPSFL